MISLAILACTGCAVAAVLIVDDVRRTRRKFNRKLRLFNDRLDRCLEDLYWQLYRQDAYEQALGLGLGKADGRLLAAIGIELRPQTHDGLEFVL